MLTVDSPHHKRQTSPHEKYQTPPACQNKWANLPKEREGKERNDKRANGMQMPSLYFYPEHAILTPTHERVEYLFRDVTNMYLVLHLEKQ